MTNTVKVGIASIMAIIFSAVLYLETLSMSRAAYQLPRILIVIIILLAIAMYAEEYYKSKKKKGQSGTEAVVKQPEDKYEKIHYDRIAVFVTAITAYIFSIKILGYFIVTPLFIIGIFRYLKSVKMSTAVVIAVGFTGFIYLLFIRFLHLPIPITMF